MHCLEVIVERNRIQAEKELREQGIEMEDDVEGTEDYEDLDEEGGEG